MCEGDRFHSPFLLVHLSQLANDPRWACILLLKESARKKMSLMLDLLCLAPLRGLVAAASRDARLRAFRPGTGLAIIRRGSSLPFAFPLGLGDQIQS